MLILNGPQEPVLMLSFAADATKLYAVHQGIGVHVWNLAARTVESLLINGMCVWAEFTLHPGGRWAFGTISIPNNHSSLIDLSTGRRKTFNFVEPWGHVALSPDGKRLVTVGLVRGARGPTAYLYGWKMTAAGPRAAWELKSPADALPWQVVFAGNGTTVTEDKRPGGAARRIAVRSPADGKVRTSFDSPVGASGNAQQVLAPPDGLRLALRSGTRMWVYDTTDWQKRPVAIAGAAQPVLAPRAAAFHPSGRYILLANFGPSVVAFDAATGEEARRWKWDAGALRAVAVSPDGTLAAAGGPSGKVVVWDLDL